MTRERGHLVEDLLLFRKPALSVLRKYQRIVCDNVEDTLITFNELDCNVEMSLQCRCQTGSARSIASENAVGDRDFHGASWIIVRLADYTRFQSALWRASAFRMVSVQRC